MCLDLLEPFAFPFFDLLSSLTKREFLGVTEFLENLIWYLPEVIMLHHKVGVFIHIVFFLFSTDDEDIINVDNASLKQGYAGLVSLILEAVKMDSDLSTIR